MAHLKKFNLSGKEIGQVAIADEALAQEANPQMVKDYIVALRANFRQWPAHTRTRAEVSHSGQKPHPQKGTGRARQGYLGAPQYKGGGRVHGPRSDAKQAFHVAINKKEKQAAIRYLLADKIRGDKLVVLETGVLKKPQTKAVANFLKGLGLFGKKVLFVAAPAENSGSFVKSVRNIPNADFMLLDNVSGYDVIAHRQLVVMDEAIERLAQLLEKKS